MSSLIAARLSTEQRRRYLRTMVESRLGDVREERLNRQGKGHFSVAGNGHEALCAVGSQLHEGDFLLPYYRDRGLCLGRGMTTKALALEYFAKRDSASRGRMMPSHFSSRELNIVSVPTPLGSQLLPACGIAWGMKLDDREDIVVTTVGDAATRQGDFYEAVGFALERQLPILFLVEDNGYGISTPTRYSNPLALGVLDPSRWEVVDGSDVEIVHARARSAIARIRAGGGPAFLWVKVERLGSHTSSDDHSLYRPPEEIEALEARDPIRVLRARMIGQGEIDADEFAAWEEELRAAVREDYRAAEMSEDPRESELYLEVSGDAPLPEEALFAPGTYRMGDLFNLALRAGLEAHPGRMVFGEDVEDPKGGVFRLTKTLSSDFPKQVFNSPLAESTIFGVGGGLALYGRRPVFELQFIDFSFPGFNQLVQNLATLRWRSNGAWKVPAVFYAPCGGYLPGGSLWHSQMNEAAFAHFPGIHVVIPSTPADAAGLLWTAMHGEDVTLFLLPKHLLWAEVLAEEPVRSIPLGRARVVTEGRDLTLVAWGNTVEKAREAIDALGGGIEVELIDLRSIMPWDRATIEASVEKTGRLLVVQEDTEACSVGQMIVTHVAGHAGLWATMKAPPRLLAKGHVPVGYSPVYEYAALPSVEGIIGEIRASLEWHGNETIDRRTGASALLADFEENGAHSSRERLRRQDTPVLPGVSLDRDKRANFPGTGASLSIDSRRATSSSLPDSVPRHVDSPAPSPEPGHMADALVVRVPVMGEGVREARLVAWFKNPGDAVSVDEVICDLETDKAVFPVESSFTGRLLEQLVTAGESVRIGQDIAILASGAGTPAPPSGHLPVPNAVPPGTVRQPVLSPAITRRLGSIVTANLTLDIPWEPLKRARQEAKAALEMAAATPSAMMAWCVTRAQESFPAFRCLVEEDGTILEQSVFDQGIAVALPGDQLATASVAAANTLSFETFLAAYHEAVATVRGGASSGTRAPLNLSSLGAFGIEKATPLVVPPAMATLFIGAAHPRLVGAGDDIHSREVVTLSLTFDHRVVNGAGAAAFLSEVKRQVGDFGLREAQSFPGSFNERAGDPGPVPEA